MEVGGDAGLFVANFAVDEPVDAGPQAFPHLFHCFGELGDLAGTRRANRLVVIAVGDGSHFVQHRVDGPGQASLHREQSAADDSQKQYSADDLDDIGHLLRSLYRLQLHCAHTVDVIGEVALLFSHRVEQLLTLEREVL